MSETRSERDPVEVLAEDFLARLRRGERPDLSEYTTQHPELADEIRDLFPALAKLERLRPGTEDEVGDAGAVVSPPLEHLGDFRILREIGRGGMGIVYEAEQVSLGRHVALKVLPGPALLDPRRIQRFRREARAAARLHHTNIVPVFGVGHDDGTPYLVMQFIRGLGLDEVLRELRRLRERRSPSDPAGHHSESHTPRENDAPITALDVARTLIAGTDAKTSVATPPPATDPSSVHLPGQPEGTEPTESGKPYWRSVGRIGVQVAEALAYAAGQGILHRDVKPSNLLLDARGTVWVTDFGLAKAETDADDLTATGDIVGTLRYLAPERLTGKGDIRSDTYSLGLTLYELLTLRPAFDETDRDRLLHRVMHEEPLRPRKVDPSIPRDLETIVLKAIAREPARRYATASALADDLRRFLADEPIQARPVGASERAWRWCRRNPALAALAALAACLMVGIAVVSTAAAVRLKSQRDTARTMSQTLAAQGIVLRAERQRALASETLARGAEATARDEAARANRLLYLSDLRLVQALWDSEDGTVDAMSNLLNRHIPRSAAEPDLRELAWRFQYTRLLGNEVLMPWATQAAIAGAQGADGQLAVLDRRGVLRRIDPVERRVVGERDLADGAKLTALALSPDGSAVALGVGAALRVVDARSGDALLTASAEGLAPVVEAVFSPTGRFVAGVRADRQVQVAEVATGRQVATGQLKEGPYRSIALTSDGQNLIATEHPERGVITVYDLVRGRTSRLKGGLGATVMQVAGSPDGRQVAAGCFNGVVYFWDRATGERLFQLRAHLARVTRLCFSDNSRWVYTGCSDGTVAVWDTTTRSNVVRFKGHAAEIVFLAPATAPRAPALITGARNGVFKFWDTAGAPRAIRPPQRRASNFQTCLAFSPDGRFLAEGIETVRLWDTRSWTPVRSFGQDEGDAGAEPPQPAPLPSSLAFTPDGALLAIGDQASRVTLREVATGRVVRTLEGIAPEFYGPPSPRAALGTPTDKRAVAAIAIAPDAALLAVGYGLVVGTIPNYDQVVKVFDLRSGKPSATLPVRNTVAWLHFSADGSSLTAASHDGNVRRWQVRDWKPLQRWFTGSPIFSAAVSRDESRLVTGLQSGRIVLWEMATGRELHRVLGHANFVAGATFSADGRTLVTSSGTSEYGMLKFWDVESGGELLQLWQEAATFDIALSPRGDVLAGVGLGGLQHWDAWPLERIDAISAEFKRLGHATAAPQPPDRPGQPGQSSDGGP
jgi:serine/threonine protein kinase/WD40 repeat protein